MDETVFECEQDKPKSRFNRSVPFIHMDRKPHDGILSYMKCVRLRNGAPYCVGMLPVVYEHRWTPETAAIHFIRTMKRGDHLVADAAFPSPAVIQACNNHGVKYTFSFSNKLYPELASVGKTNLLDQETRVLECEPKGQTVCFYSDSKVVKVITNNFSTHKTGVEELKEKEQPLYSLATTKHFLHMSNFEWEQVCVPLLRKKGIDTSKSREDALMQLTGWILTANPPVNTFVEEPVRPVALELEYKGVRYEKPQLRKNTVKNLQKIASDLKMNLSMSNITKETLIDRIYKRTHPEQFKEKFIEGLVDAFLHDKIKGKPSPLDYYSAKFNLVDRMDHWFYQDLYDKGRKDFDWESFLMWCLVDIGAFGAWGIYCDLNNLPLVRQNGMKNFLLDLADEVLAKYRPKQYQKDAGETRKRKKEEKEELPEDEYEVEKLLSSKTRGGKVYYLVKWKGYSTKDATWEYEMDLHCPKLLREFYLEKKNRKDVD